MICGITEKRDPLKQHELIILRTSYKEKVTDQINNHPTEDHIMSQYYQEIQFVENLTTNNNKI
jgi:hypothetical protein